MIKAGANPILIPLGLSEDNLLAILDLVDGILFTGGGDIDPIYYRTQPHPLIKNIDPERDRVELLLAKAAANGGIPFLGICRGLQTVNVALGGTLYADILAEHPNPIQHACFEDHPREHLAHSIRIQADSCLAKILKNTTAMVNSGHHQGIRELAPDLRPTAYSSDGIIEAFELPDHPFGLTVQWHPEWLTHIPAMFGIFEAFMEAVQTTKIGNNPS
jgi:putative glutamine amidotransferase